MRAVRSVPKPQWDPKLRRLFQADERAQPEGTQPNRSSDLRSELEDSSDSQRKRPCEGHPKGNRCSSLNTTAIPGRTRPNRLAGARGSTPNVVGAGDRSGPRPTTARPYDEVLYSSSGGTLSRPRDSVEMTRRAARGRDRNSAEDEKDDEVDRAHAHRVHVAELLADLALDRQGRDRRARDPELEERRARREARAHRVHRSGRCPSRRR